MKKIISLIAAVSMFVALSTSAFAYKADESSSVTGATLSGTTITYDAASTEGFVFSITASEAFRKSAYAINVADLEEKGWTISDPTGTECFGGAIGSNLNGVVQSSYNFLMAGNPAGSTVITFKAVPGAGATIDGATFTITSANVMSTSNQQYIIGTATGNVSPITFTVKAAASGPKVEATENTDGSYSVSGSETLKDKKVLFDTTKAVITVSDSLTEASRLWVTYTDGENVTKKNYNIYAAVDAEGAGEWTGSTVAFGIVYNPADWDASKFSFEIK